MAEPANASLGQIWDVSASITISNASTILSDDDLDSLALASELEDGIWDDSDDDNDSLSPLPLERSVDDYRQTTARAEAIEHEPETSRSSYLSNGVTPDLTLSDAAASEDTGSTSTFSFHFPDPLREQPEAHPRYDIFRDDTDSLISRESLRNFGTDLVASVNALDRSATLKPPPSGPPLATYRWRTWVAMYAKYLPMNPLDEMALTRWRLCSFIAVIALLSVAVLNLRPSSTLVREYGGSESFLSKEPDPYIVPPGSGDTSQDDGRHPADTHPASPVTLEMPPRSHFPIPALPAETRMVLHTNRTVIMSLSLRPISRVVASLSYTYSTFSKAFLNDIRNVARIIEELLLYLRETIIVEAARGQSRNVLEYLTEKMADRHERAKRNAKALTAKGVDFVRNASRGISDAVKAMGA